MMLLLTPGQYLLAQILRGLWKLAVLAVLGLLTLASLAVRGADRLLRWAAYRYRMRGVTAPASNVVPLRKR